MMGILWGYLEQTSEENLLHSNIMGSLGSLGIEWGYKVQPEKKVGDLETASQDLGPADQLEREPEQAEEEVGSKKQEEDKEKEETSSPGLAQFVIVCLTDATEVEGVCRRRGDGQPAAVPGVAAGGGAGNSGGGRPLLHHCGLDGRRGPRLPGARVGQLCIPGREVRHHCHQLRGPPPQHRGREAARVYLQGTDWREEGDALVHSARLQQRGWPLRAHDLHAQGEQLRGQALTGYSLRHSQEPGVRGSLHPAHAAHGHHRLQRHRAAHGCTHQHGALHQHTCEGPTQQLVNGRKTSVYVIHRKGLDAEGNVQLLRSTLTRAGLLVEHVWLNGPFSLRISPLADIAGTAVRVPLYRHWQDDMQATSLYLDRKTRQLASQCSYFLDHPEIKALIADFVQAVLLAKPENVLPFAITHFAAFNAEVRPHESSEEPASFEVREESEELFDDTPSSSLTTVEEEDRRRY